MAEHTKPGMIKSNLYKIRHFALVMLSNRNAEYREQIKKYYADEDISTFEKMIIDDSPASIHIYIYLKSQDPPEIKEQCIVYFMETHTKLDKATFVKTIKKVAQTFSSEAKRIRLIIVAPEAGMASNAGSGTGRTKSNIEKHLYVYAEDYTKNNKQLIIPEYFTQTALGFDLVSHRLVPKHILVKQGTEKEKEILTITPKEKMAKIMVTDVVAKYYAAEVGDIFIIVRPSQSTGFAIDYRVVID